jgi:hypothetical protein
VLEITSLSIDRRRRTWSCSQTCHRRSAEDLASILPVVHQQTVRYNAARLCVSSRICFTLSSQPRLRRIGPQGHPHRSVQTLGVSSRDRGRNLHLPLPSLIHAANDGPGAEDIMMLPLTGQSQIDAAEFASFSRLWPADGGNRVSRTGRKTVSANKIAVPTILFCRLSCPFPSLASLCKMPRQNPG